MPTAPVINLNLQAPRTLTPAPVPILVFVPNAGLMYNQFLTPAPVPILIFAPTPVFMWPQFMTPSPVQIRVVIPDPAVAFNYFGTNFVPNANRMFTPKPEKRAFLLTGTSRHFDIDGESRVVKPNRERRGFKAK